MRKSVAIIALLLFPALLRAQSDRSETGAASWREKGVVTIREVPVWGRRPMKSIGVQETRLDSLILKENIALSIADVLTFNSPIFVKQYGRATLRPYRSAARALAHAGDVERHAHQQSDAGHDRLFR